MSGKGLVFISYKRDDQAVAEQVRDRLRVWGWRTWMDIDDIPEGAYWPDEIQKGLEAADVVVGVLSPRSLQSRNVKNEWDWTIVKKPGQLFLLMIETCDVPMQYISINRTDFSTDHTAGFTRLQTALGRDIGHVTAVPLQHDPYREYLQQLYERINLYLAQRIIRKGDNAQPDPLRLRSGSTPEAVDALFAKQEGIDPLFEAGGIAVDASKNDYEDFGQAFEQYEGRVLLLGEPGAGKTITLLHFAREAVVRRIQDPTHKLPMLAIIPEWQRQVYPDLAEWMGRSYGAAADAAQAVREGRALLLLDGLDELPRQAPVDPQKPEGEQFDPRRRFMGMVNALIATQPHPLTPSPFTERGNKSHTNQVVVTCRAADYEQMGEKIGLRGAVTLKPLDEGQIKAYLQDVPGFWEAVEADAGLKEIAQTPLLLSIMAFAFRDRKDELKALSDLKEGALRDAIFTAYIEERYAHEARKLKLKGQTPPFTLEDLWRDLGWIAMMNAAGGYGVTANVLTERDFWRAVGSKKTPEFIAFAEQLNLITKGEAQAWRFIHLRLRDTLAYRRGERLVQDSLEKVRKWAIKAMSGIADRRTMAFSLELLKDDNWEIQCHAAEVLGAIKDPQAIPHLLPLLWDENWYVHDSATLALGQIGMVALEALLPLMKDDNLAVRSRAAVALGAIGITALNQLLPLLKDDDSDVRCRVAIALGKMQDEEAVPHLVSLLKDRNWRVRYSAADALGLIRDSSAVSDLVPLLTDSNWHVSRSAADAIGKLGSKAVQYLLPLLLFKDRDIRRRAVQTLGEISDTEAVPYLIPLIEDEDVRDSAIRALGKIGDARAVSRLIPLLKHKEGLIRGHTAVALGLIKDSQAVPHLISLLRDEDEDVRDHTSYALGQMGNAVMSQLLPLLKDLDWRVRSGVADALGKMGNSAVPYLIPLLKDRNEDVRYKTVFALGEIEDSQAVPYLIPLLAEDSIVGESATEVLGRMGIAPVPYLIPLLKGMNADVRRYAADVLGDIGDADVLPHLQILLEDAPCAENAAAALEAICNERGLRLSAAWREKNA